MKKLNLSTKGILWSFILIIILMIQLLLYNINSFTLKAVLTLTLAILAFFTGYKSIKHVSDSMKTEPQIGITNFRNYFSSAVVGIAVLNYLYGILNFY